MRIRHWLTLTAFCLALTAVATGLRLTRPQPPPSVPETPAVKAAPTPGGPGPTPGGPGPKPGGPGPQAGGIPRPQRLVDESPLLTARALLPLALSPEEQRLVRQAERVANHEVDLAFSDLMRQTTENPPESTPQTLALKAQKEAGETAVETGKKHIEQLTRQMATAKEADKDRLEDQVEVAKAELELEQDELDQASEELDHLGGDLQGRIRRLRAAHNAADVAVTPPPAPAPPRFYQPGSLLAKVNDWLDSRRKLARLDEARREALGRVERLGRWRIKLAKRVQDEKEGREAAKGKATGFATGATGAASREEAKANVETLKHFMSGQRRLLDLGKRVKDQRELADIYGNWMGLADGQRREALHLTLQYVLGILFILLGLAVLERFFSWRFQRVLLEEKRVGRMFKVLKVSVLALGTLAILLVIFGMPSQMTTLFGLAGAGLTVALKDFIVAFFGWFILVGRNGIHVGDWVEIKGVGGEVVEIGLLRTMLMETGNWSDSGHPTGRIVSFVNSFAIEGHFFNFSTSGQWMWDELKVVAPPGQDPYPFIDAIRELVVKATEANATLAAAEWRKSSKSNRVHSFSALPGVNVVPTASGIEVRVRYITRAYERHETQATLNQALVELMHGKNQGAQPAAGPAV